MKAEPVLALGWKGGGVALRPAARRGFRSRAGVLCAGALGLVLLTSPLHARWGFDALPAEGHEALADYYLRHGQFMEAEAELRNALDSFNTWDRLTQRRVVQYRERLARTLIAQRAFASAEAEYRTILAIRLPNGPEDKRKILFYQANLGAMLAIQGKIGELRALVARIDPGVQRLLRPNDTTRLGIELLQKAAAWKEPTDPEP